MEEQNGNIVGWLMERQFDLLVLDIFLNLDSKSLRAAKSVCQDWKQFIDKWLWSTPTGRRRVEQLLEDNFLNDSPDIRMMEAENAIFDIHCDKNDIICGSEFGHIGVWDLQTLENRFYIRRHTRSVQLTFNDEAIFSVDYTPTIIVSSRKDGSMIYVHHYRLSSSHTLPIFGLRIWNDTLATCSKDSNIKFYSINLPKQGEDDSEMQVQQPLPALDHQHNDSSDSDDEDNEMYYSAKDLSQNKVLELIATKTEHHRSVSHLDNNGTILVSGDSDGIVIVWDFDKKEEVSRFDSEHYIMSLSLSMPHIATCSIHRGQGAGARLFNMEGQLLRSFPFPVSDIQISQKWLLLCPGDEYDDYGPMELWSLQDLKDKNIALDRVRHRDLLNLPDIDSDLESEFDPEPNFKAAVIKKSFIVNCEGTRIAVRSFWP